VRVFNATVLKRFTAAWNAADFYPFAVDFYGKLSEKVQKEIFVKTPILRIFKSVEEQNNWTVASDKKELQNFLSSEFLKNKNPSIEAPLGFGEVLGTARINAEILLDEYRKFQISKDVLVSEKFQYEQKQQQDSRVIYRNISAKRIIFCEGSKVIENPFFPRNAIIGNKGEYLIIK